MATPLNSPAHQLSISNHVGKWIFIAAAAIVLVGALTWVNYHYCVQNPGGNDFLVHWSGTRTFLTDRISPYSDTAALRIQTIAYGRPALPGEHELRVAYPFYSAILFAPFALIPDFTLARAAWMTLLEVALILLAIFSLRLAKWQPPLALLAAILIFILIWYFGLRGLINGNPVILVSLALAGAFLFIGSGKDAPAGILLALATIKPQVAIVPLVWVLLWSFSTRRWRIIGWTFGSIATLFLLATILLPSWPLENLREILRYPGYNPPGTPGAALATWWPGSGQIFGIIISIAIAALVANEWRQSWNQGFESFLWAAGVTLIASQWSGIQTDPGNFIVLTIPLILALAAWNLRLGRYGPLAIAALLVIMLIGFWAVFILTLQTVNGQPQQSPVMFFPLPALLFLLYYGAGRQRIILPLPQPGEGSLS